MSIFDNATENESFSGSTDTPDDIDSAMLNGYEEGFFDAQFLVMRVISDEMNSGKYRDWSEVQQTLTTIMEKVRLMVIPEGNDLNGR